MDYKQKLIDFNSTEKYQRELQFLAGLIGNETADVLDFGCGIGTAVKYLSQHIEGKVYGYDIKHYSDEKHNWYLEQTPRAKYGHIYFMHSLAHIENVEQTLIKLKENLLPGGKITVITPNKSWLEEIGDTKSDQTVIDHFTPESIYSLFYRAGYEIILEGQFGDLESMYGHNERLFIQVQI